MAYQLIISLLKIASSDCYHLWKPHTHFMFIFLPSPVLGLVLVFQHIAVRQRLSCPQSHVFKKNKAWERTDLVPA